MITIIAALGDGGLRLTDSPEPPVSNDAAVTVLGAISVLILFRIIDPPSFGSFGGVSVDGTVEFGIFLGLIAAAGIAYGGYMAMKEEGTSFGDTADRLSAAPAPPPPPSSPPSAAATSTPPPPQPPARRLTPTRRRRTAQHAAAGPAPGSSRRLRVARLVGWPGAFGDPAGDLLGEGDHGHHRVDADRGGEEGGVGDVEAAGAVDRAVGGADALAGVGGDSRRAHRVEGLEAQLRGLEAGRLELGELARPQDADAGDVGVDLGGAGGEVDLGGAGDAEGEAPGVVVGELVGGP